MKEGNLAILYTKKTRDTDPVSHTDQSYLPSPMGQSDRIPWVNRVVAAGLNLDQLQRSGHTSSRAVRKERPHTYALIPLGYCVCDCQVVKPTLPTVFVNTGGNS
jgi:hypothetical protein